MNTTAPLLLAALAASATAQYDTLPTGYMLRHGDYSSGSGVSYPFGRTLDFRYQEVHASWTGRTAVPPLTAVGFRRGSFRAANATAVAHTADLTFTVGHGDLATFANTYAGNYTGPATLVFATRTVRMPDWTQPIVPPWVPTLWLPFDAPFSFNAAQDLVWELLVQNSTLPNLSSANYYSDRTGTTTSSAVATGTGCIATGRTAAATMPITWGNNGRGSTMTVRATGSNLPASAPVLLALGLGDPDLPVPGLCANLRSTADLVVPLGSSSATGSLASTTLTFPYSPLALRFPFYTQGIAPDAGQPGLPLLLTDGRVGSMPPGPGQLKYIYSLNAGASVSGPFTAGSVITTWQ